jgi:cyclophilin family peptidyl-prolyl cis-trans isomerase
MRALTILALLLTTLSRLGAATPPPPGTPEVVVLKIKVGREKKPQRVVISLRPDAAPQTVENFKKLIHKKFYDGLRFHRVIPKALVQTGDPRTRWWDGDLVGTGGPGYTLPAEIKLPSIEGAVAMARLDGPINPTKASNGSQFFVCLDALPKLNGEYTIFGQVIEGMEVLHAISKLPTDSNDFPVDKIVIKSMRLEPYVIPAS